MGLEENKDDDILNNDDDFEDIKNLLSLMNKKGGQRILPSVEEVFNFVPENLKTLEMCLIAVQQSGNALEYVPDNLRLINDE